MKKEISFSEGMKLTPYSDVSPDGELSVLENLEVYNGSIRPVDISGTEATVSSGVHIDCMHSTISYKHFVFHDESGNYYWAACSESGIPSNIAVSDNKKIATSTQIGTVNDISSMGNILVFACQDEIKYAQWDDNTYKFLGPIPDLDIEFSLLTQYVDTRSNTKAALRYTASEVGAMSAEAKYNVYSIAAQNVEEAYSNCADGKFVYPFFVRAAYKLYDGRTFVKHTSPVFMVPSTYGPLPYIDNDDRQGREGGYVFACKLLLGTLQYKINSITQGWDDIITSVDIAVSLPIIPYSFTYDENAERSGRAKTIDYRSLSKGLASTGDSDHYQIGWWDIEKTKQTRVLNLKEQEQINEFGETSSFYTLKSIKYNDLTTDRTNVTMPKGWYKAQATRTDLLLKDDSGSHNKTSAKIAMSYNGRVNIANITKSVPMGNKPDSCITLTDSNVYKYKFWIRGSKNGANFEEYIGQSSKIPNYKELDEETGSNIYHEIMYYFYTPNVYATDLLIGITDTSVTENDDERYLVQTIKLKDHPFLEGKYMFEYDGMELVFSETFTPVQKLMTENLGNYIYTSESYNPFVFSYKGQNATGSGEILSLATVTTPIGYEPHGTHPLMALCTDGNYSLELITSGEDAGLYSSVSPMQRDVCVNKDSVTMIEDGILYVSNRGLMVAKGNDITCISKALDGVSEVEGFNPRTIFESCKIVWDYTNQRAMAFSIGSSEAVVWNRESNTWSTITLSEEEGEEEFKNVINTFPYSYLHIGNRLVKMDDDYNFNPLSTHANGKIVTRPIKMDTLLMKKLTEFALQGRFSVNQTIKVYGSNDLVNWYNIGTTTRRRVGHFKGYYYKYWRFEIDTNLTESENITGLELRYDIRKESRMR